MIMNLHIFIKRSRFPVSAEDLFAWHCAPGALARLTPPWESVIISKQEPLREGSITVFYLKIGFMKIKWIAKHIDYMKNRRFTDIQVRGPFSSWRHTHTFIPVSGNSSFLEDSIQYRLKFHPVSTVIAGRFVKRKLEKMFSYRHSVTKNDLVRKKTRKPITIAMTGTSGFIAGHLIPYLSTQGHQITRLVRCEPPSEGEAFWDSDEGILDCAFTNTDAVIHLAGEPIGEGIWTGKKMRSIMQSRVAGTRLIAERLAAMDRPPATFISASAIGYYGNRGDALLGEDDPHGSDFISEVCHEWESAARPAAVRGIRVVFLRIGVVLHPGGGALKRYLPPARLGLGSIIGEGNQYISWVTMEDVIGAIDHILFNTNISGPVNIATPHPVMNRELVKTLARVLGRPALLTLPAWIILPVFGKMGREVLLSSTRVSSQKLISSGYRFRHENLDDAIAFLLGR
jgi:uncharacterized protein (TIGR01777 family)